MTLGIHATGFRARVTPAPPAFLLVVFLGLVGLFAGTGCVHHPAVVSPALPLTEREARELTRDLERGRPAELARPVVVLGGYHSPGFNESRVTRLLRRYTSDDRDDFLVVKFTTRVDFDRMVDKAIREIERRWPSDDPDWTTEVDVVGLSMGGLVARYGAVGPVEPGARTSSKRLNISRLFTIATPHRGARLAEAIAPNRAAREMRPGSALLGHLDAGLPDAGYTLVPYARLQDDTIGPPDRAAPHGTDPIWVDGPWIGSHYGSGRDERILLDIALRLRNEPAIGSPAPVPDPDTWRSPIGPGGRFLDEEDERDFYGVQGAY